MNLGKVAFILCGGGFSGAYSVGFLKALAEKGIKPDLVQGISVGALNGFKYVENGGDITSLEKKWLKVQDLGKSAIFNWRDILKRFKKSSLYNNEQIFKLLIQDMNTNAILESPIHFQVVTINESRSRRIVFSNKSEEVKNNPGLLSTAVMASLSIAGLLPPILINGEWYSDGQAPKLKEAIKMKCDTIFVFINHKFVTNETDSGRWIWAQRLAHGMVMSNISWIVKEIKYLAERGYKLIENCPSAVFSDVGHPLSKEIKQKIKKIAEEVVEAVTAESPEDAERALAPHRIVILSPPHPISSLYTVGFRKPDPKTGYPGDISAAMEQGYTSLDSNFWKKLG